MSEYEVDRVQLDALWSYVGKNDKKQVLKKGGMTDAQGDDFYGKVWRATMLETETCLRVGRGIAGNEREATEAVLRMLKRQRGHPDDPSPTMSDTRSGTGEAMIEVYGEVPEASKLSLTAGTTADPEAVGRGPDVVQVVKDRDETGCVECLSKRGLGPSDARQQFRESIAHVERTHLTMRHMNGRLVREGLGFSKKGSARVGGRSLQPDASPESLRIDLTGRLEGEPGRRWERRTPAMTTGLASEIWSIEKLLYTVVPP